MQRSCSPSPPPLKALVGVCPVPALALLYVDLPLLLSPMGEGARALRDAARHSASQRQQVCDE
eukprot:4040332-Pyramimonas_sp.AAC.1